MIFHGSHAEVNKMKTTLFLILSAVVLTTCNVVDVLRFESEADVVCPDGNTVCEGPSSTCCRSQSGEWNCCPFEDGQCCSDGAHCCPSGTTCDVSRSACLPLTSNSTSQPISWPAVRRVPQTASGQQSSRADAGLVCPDRTSQCSSVGAACCRDKIGRYACCNYPMNVCCDDGMHCCRSGTVCDGLYNRCIPYPNVDSISWTVTVSATTDGAMTVEEAIEQEQLAQMAATSIAEDNQEQEEKQQQQTNVYGYCPDGTGCSGTCCLQSTKPLSYRCCPYVFASCCAGGNICCPNGYDCFGGLCFPS